MPDDTPFHAGERAIQSRLGVLERVQRAGRRFIRRQMPEQHREFYARLPVLFVGSVDGEGRPWASVLAGEAGFVQCPSPSLLTISATPLAGDVLDRHLAEQARLGLLGIELHTRRRNRMNGTVQDLAPGLISVAVDQSFGNCPKYINARTLRPRIDQTGPAVPCVSPALTARARAILEIADVVFIATSHAPESAGTRFGVDISHRGGLPGFVRIGRDGELYVPDYAGNSFFNTLGNIAADGRAGLMAIDFATGDVLQLTGSAEIDWEVPEVDNGSGVQRFVKIAPESVRLLPHAFPFVAEFHDYSPFLSKGGQSSS